MCMPHHITMRSHSKQADLRGTSGSKAFLLSSLSSPLSPWWSCWDLDPLWNQQPMCSASCFPLDGESLTKACSDSPLSTAWVTHTAGWEVVFGFVLFCFLNHGEVETSLELSFWVVWFWGGGLQETSYYAPKDGTSASILGFPISFWPSLPKSLSPVRTGKQARASLPFSSESPCLSLALSSHLSDSRILFHFVLIPMVVIWMWSWSYRNVMSGW